MTTKLLKREAMAVVDRESGSSLCNSTTHFANLNAGKSVWWFDIPVEKFTAGTTPVLDILVFSQEAQELHHLQVPTAYIRENFQKFHVRDDKNTVSLELSAECSNRFQDVRPGSGRLSFAHFLAATVLLSNTRNSGDG